MFPMVSYHGWYSRSLKSQKLCFCSAVKNKEMIGLMISLLRFLVATMWLTHLTFDLGIQHFISLWSSCPLSQCVALLPPFFFCQCICSHSLSLTLTSQTHTHTHWTLLTAVLLSIRSVNICLSTEITSWTFTSCLHITRECFQIILCKSIYLLFSLSLIAKNIL